MKRLLFFAALLLTVSSISAQNTLSDTDFYEIGTSETYFGLDTTGIVEGMGGSGLTWDFSSAQPNGQTRIVSVGAASSHPQGSAYPTSDYALDFSTGQYRFFSEDDDSLVLDGEISLLNSPINFDLKPTIYKFPLNLNDLQSDTLDATYNTTAGTARRFGSYNTLYDGDGTLTLPGGVTYSNVSRIVTLIQYRDSSTAFPIFTDVTINRYEWFVPGSTLPVMISDIQIASANGGPNNLTKDIFYLDTGFVNVDQVLVSEGLELFPNPAESQVRINYELKGAADVNLAIYNVQGELVYRSPKGEQAAGQYNEDINLDDFTSGVYLVRLTAGGQTLIEKLIIQ